MPRRTTASEHFRFADEWEFDYSFRVNVNARPKDPLGICSEGPSLTIAGPLRSKSRRRCSRVQVTFSLMPTLDTDAWNPEWKGFGSTAGISQGTMLGYARLPPSSFQCLLVALTAEKVTGAYLGVDYMERGRGIITTFFTVDPARGDEDDARS